MWQHTVAQTTHSDSNYLFQMLASKTSSPLPSSSLPSLPSSTLPFLTALPFLLSLPPLLPQSLFSSLSSSIPFFFFSCYWDCLLIQLSFAEPICSLVASTAALTSAPLTQIPP